MRQGWRDWDCIHWREGDRGVQDFNWKRTYRSKYILPAGRRYYRLTRALHEPVQTQMLYNSQTAFLQPLHRERMEQAATNGYWSDISQWFKEQTGSTLEWYGRIQLTGYTAHQQQVQVQVSKYPNCTSLPKNSLKYISSTAFWVTVLTDRQADQPRKHTTLLDEVKSCYSETGTTTWSKDHIPGSQQEIDSLQVEQHRELQSRYFHLLYHSPTTTQRRHIL